jgi:tetratricopeptide (TPR) repeat protein
MLGNKNDLKMHYESILAIDPQNTSAHYKKGVLDYGKKDYVNALIHFEKIVSLYPCDTDGLLMLGWTNFQLGKVSEAKDFFNKVLCLSPNNASALQGIASKPADPNKKTGF